MAASNLYITAQVSPLAGGQASQSSGQVAYPPIASSTSPGAVLMVSLTTGANTVTLPTGTSTVVVQPPAGNTVAVALTALSSVSTTTSALVLPLLAGTTTLGLTSAGAVTVQVLCL